MDLEFLLDTDLNAGFQGMDSETVFRVWITTGFQGWISSVTTDGYGYGFCFTRADYLVNFFVSHFFKERRTYYSQSCVLFRNLKMNYFIKYFITD